MIRWMGHLMREELGWCLWMNTNEWLGKDVMYYCRKSKVHGSTVVRKGVILKVVGTMDGQSQAGLSVGAFGKRNGGDWMGNWDAQLRTRLPGSLASCRY